MKLNHVFTVPLAEFHMDAPDGFWAESVELFSAKALCGATYGAVDQHGNNQVFESRADLFDWQEPGVRRIAEFCHRSLARVVRAVTDHSDAEFAGLQFDYHSWFQITRTDGFQAFHNQPNGSWAGLLVIDPGDPQPERPESGTVMLHDARVNANYFQDSGNTRLKYPAMQCAYRLEQEQGKLFVFPSFLLQETFAYFGRRPRIIVHFNCWIRPEFDRSRIGRERSRVDLLNPVATRRVVSYRAGRDEDH